MKQKIIFMMILLISISISKSTVAMCTIAPMHDTSYCEYDQEGSCCLMQYKKDGMSCLEVWCYQFDQCSWAQVLPPWCI